MYENETKCEEMRNMKTTEKGHDSFHFLLELERILFGL